MEQNVSERIQLIINHYHNGNKTRFAERCDVLPQAVNQWLRKGISKTSMDKICRVYPEVSREWLFFGTGEMFGNESVIINNQSNNTGNFDNSFNSGSSSVETELRQQIKDLKEQIAAKDEQIKNLINIISKGNER